MKLLVLSVVATLISYGLYWTICKVEKLSSRIEDLEHTLDEHGIYP